MRIVFMLHPITATTFSVWSVFKMFFIGLLSDAFVIVLASSILMLYFLFIANVKYKKPYGGIILGSNLSSYYYYNTVLILTIYLHKYGGVDSRNRIELFFGFKTLCFALLLFLT